jgi:lambda repressor-like predicted transcriptional regulator
MASATLKSKPTLQRGEATMAAALIAAYVECSEPIQQVVLEMIDIIESKESTSEDRDAALNTLIEALFTGKTTEFCEEEDAVVATEGCQAVSAQLDSEHGEFAARVRSLMAKKGLNQADLAREAGITQPAVANILNRNCRPQRRTVIKFAVALGVEPHELWPDDEDLSEGE